jgi:hypothetical protein
MTPTAVRVPAAASPGLSGSSGSSGSPRASAAASAGLAPLTHHEILALVEPFVHAGLAPDLAASDRAARRVAFRARAVAPQGLPELPPQLAAQPLTECWGLDASEPGELALWRELAWPQGPAARLEGRCPDGSPAGLAALLEAMLGVPPGRLFVLAPAGSGGAALGALTQRLALPGEPGRAEPALVLKAAQAQVGGLTLRMSLSGVGGYPAEIELLRPVAAAGTPGAAAGSAAGALAAARSATGATRSAMSSSPPPVARRLPQDLLAVLGRAWEPLTELSRGWVARVTVRGEEPRRSHEARAHFTRALAHVAATLAEPPARYHARHRAARWAVVGRGLTPWLVGLGIVAVALWARQRGGSSVLALLANVAPPLLMGLFFVRREMPRIALPRWPARLADDAWPVPVPVPVPEPAQPLPEERT